MYIFEKIFLCLMHLSLFCLAAGIFTSVSLLGVHTSALGLASLLFYLKDFKQIKNLPKSSYPLMALVVIGLISFGLNYSETDQPFEMLGKLKYFAIAALGVMPVQYFVGNLSDRSKKNYIILFIVSIIIASVYGFIGAINDNQIGDHIFSGLGKRSGGLTDIMRFSYGLALVFPIGLSFLLHHPKLSWLPSKKWIATLLLFCVFGIITSQSRGPMLGVALAVAVVLFFTRKKLAISILFLMTIFIGAFVFFIQSSQFKIENSFYSRIFQNLNSSSTSYRISQYKTALYAVSEKPLFGHGMGRFQPQVERIKKQYDLPEKQFINHHSHNVFLEIAAQLGLLGTFFMFTWILLWGVEKFKAGQAYLFIPFTVTFCVIGQLEQIFLTNNMVLTFAFYQLSQISVNKQKI